MTTPAHTGERVQWSGSVSHWHYLGRWLFVLLLLAAAVGTFFYPDAEAWPGVWILRLSLLGLALIIAFVIHLDRRARRYTVTDLRVAVEYGLISRQSNEIRIQDVQSINLQLSGIKGFLGIGRVEFSSAATDDAEVVFWNTPGAAKVRDLVRNLQSPVITPRNEVG